MNLKGLTSSLDYSLRIYRTSKITYGKYDMIQRSFLLDILKTKNRDELLKFNFFKYFIPSSNTFCSRAVEELQIYIEGYSIDDVISSLDISLYSKTMDTLCGDLKMKSVGGKNVDLSPHWDDNNNYYNLPKCLQYLISALRLQNLSEPQFTDFRCVPKDIPMRLESGEPNYEFFKQWNEQTQRYVEGK